MNRVRFAFLAIIFAVFTKSLIAVPLDLEVAAEGAILVNAKTGAVLYEKNSNQQFFPASITKTATAWWALKTNKERLHETITASQDAVASVSGEAIRRSNYTMPSWWIELGSSHVGIKKGEELSLKDLLHGLMLRSGNDAANVIAQYVGGSIPNFLEDLNNAMQSIGMENTHFTNPHGLHNPKHVTTPYDMSILARSAMQDETFREIVRTIHYTRPKTDKNDSTVWVQTNQLLRQGKNHYSKAIGIKTGYHSAAQHNLVAAAEDNGRILIAVLMKTPERSDMFSDAKKLFEAAFNQPKVQKTLIEKGPQKFVLNLAGATMPVTTRTDEDVKINYYPAEAPQLKCLLAWDEIELPVKRDQRVGELRFVGQEERVLKTIPLYAQEDVNSGWSYWFKKKLGFE